MVEFPAMLDFRKKIPTSTIPKGFEDGPMNPSEGWEWRVEWHWSAQVAFVFGVECGGLSGRDHSWNFHFATAAKNFPTSPFGSPCFG